MSKKSSSLFENVITFGTAVIIALGVVFGALAVYSLNSVIQAKDRVLAIGGESEKAAAAAEQLELHAESKAARAMNYLVTGQPKPYLEEMSAERNEFLGALRDLRTLTHDARSKEFLDRIEQTEMDHQLALQKAVDSRRQGPNYIAISILMQSQVHPKREALRSLLNDFTGYREGIVARELAQSREAAEAAAEHSAKLVRTAALGALVLAGLILLLNIALMAARRRRENAAIRSEQQLRVALDAAEIATWERDLEADAFDKSQRHLRLYGFQKDPPIWNFETFLRAIMPEDRERVKRKISEAIEQCRDYSVEFRVKWPDKSVHWIFSKGRVFGDADKKPVRVAGVDTLSDRVHEIETDASELEEELPPGVTFKSESRLDH